MSVTVTTYRVIWYADNGDEAFISDNFESAEDALSHAQEYEAHEDAVVESVQVTPLHSVRMVMKTTKIT